jgi:hypothetical protein
VTDRDVDVVVVDVLVVDADDAEALRIPRRARVWTASERHFDPDIGVVTVEILIPDDLLTACFSCL